MPVSAYCDNTPNVMLPAPGLPKLAADVTIIGQVSYCKNFNLNITIINHGNELADDVHLFFEQFPGGFFSLINIDHAYTPVNRYLVDIALSDLKPNEQKDVNLIIYVPFQKNLNAEWLRKFLFNFSTSYGSLPQEFQGRVTFMAGHGKIMTQKFGFTQSENPIEIIEQSNSL